MSKTWNCCCSLARLFCRRIRVFIPAQTRWCKSWTPWSPACSTTSACRTNSRRAGRKKRSDMKKEKHSTFNIQHSTPKDLGMDTWEFKEGDGGNRKFDLEDRLLEFASAVIDLSESLPATRAGNHVAGQVLRSGTSPYP